MPPPPLPYTPPLDKDPEKRVGCIVDGIASLVPQLKDYDADYVPWKSLEEKRKEKVTFLFIQSLKYVLTIILFRLK